MSSTDAVEQLIERDVFEPVDADGLRPTESFREAVDRHRRTLAERDPDERSAAVAELADDPETTDTFEAAAVTDPDFLARYVALRNRTDDLSPAQALTLTVVIGQFESGTPRADGAPEAFLPVSGEDLVRLVKLHERCVVYAWREDCPPCDAIRSDFDELFGDEPPGDLLLLAVYGPDCPRLLDREFDVSGAPTTLFTLDGRVDSRFVGAPSTEGLETEIETLRERTPPSAE
ncbi:thioredoxin [Haloplanus rubicundus]|uniref:Thioredoxin n=1 Tax=Haloplanus rubicundus TaxID=1547898 RepID=A0A345E1M6_9EURY|nr:thioredoxin family protein [Haloplanus rubicundus]AXG06098.1 thioredoxin [Haloplanus rubicundus]